MTDLFHESDSDVDHAESDPRSARAERRLKAKRAAQRRRTMFTFVVMVMGLAILVVAALVFVRPLFSGNESSPSGPGDYPGPGAGAATIVVNAGDSGAAIGATLVEADVVASVDAFVAAYNANASAAGIQPGTYELMQQMRAVDAVTAVLDPASRSDAGSTVPEGWRATQIYARLAENMEIDVAEVEAAADELTLPDEAEGAVEGWLFASTYRIAPEAEPAEVLQEMVDMTVTVLERNDVPREDWRDVIIKASIIEREVAREEDRPNVAEVIENRLAYCDDTGRLGMDSTLVYELGKPGNELTRTELDTETPYNTHVIPGLPPTAIASPGEAAIAAAANPPGGDFCYFVTVNLDTGETKFTGDYQEFLQFRDEYREWLDANR
ncbi:endolytic transglycosylase MltG [Pseudactinotalea sp.]|uniref:endolytic transglycosylase MltG n=1 Tax=Pseudactinotalea sp. TaxID=1926260 RepID=UPI003B3B35DD